MPAAARLQIDYPRPADIRRKGERWWGDVLAVVRYARAGEAPGCARADLPAALVHLPVLAGRGAGVEVWRLAGPMRSGRLGRVQYRRQERLLFAALSIAEQEFAVPGATAPQCQAGALREATRAAYHELFEVLCALGYPHLLRIWNVLPQIHGATHRGERYWDFNGGRQDAFIGVRREITGNVPAASALGSPQAGPLTVNCIASHCAQIPLGNPRQVNPWDYPAQYGPQSPTFARGCIESGPAQTLFVSGTASIVGHETAHAGDVREQTRETLRNIDSVLAAANAHLGAPRHALERLSYKVYVRRPEDLAHVERELRGAVGPEAQVLFLNAEICRRDLLVEIEAVGS
jgi:enamine deaminase RidA (YjgF/YER057c/UK114 family)